MKESNQNEQSKPSLLENIDAEKTEFYKLLKKGGIIKRTKTSPLDIFESYHPLDELITSNLSNSRIDRDALLGKWRTSKKPLFIARICLSDNSKLELKVGFRTTDLKKTTCKRPNIVHLQEDGQTKLILRKPEFYNACLLDNCLFSKDYGFNIQKNLHSQNLIDENRPAIIPEIYFLLALENLYESNIENFPRITPKYKEIKRDNIYIREWLTQPINDSPLNIKKLAKHLAFLHSLGISTYHDRQKEHYYLIKDDNKTSIATIDPDFAIWIPQLPLNEEIRDEEIELEEENARTYKNNFIEDRESFLDEFGFDLITRMHFNRYYKAYLATYLSNYQELSADFISKINEFVEKRR
ncbi:MAG: hypothetical protein N3D20_03210 [Candidatus Pacearchaeota archaeon]|nr:hypothetical protein [Candidatus Pacearchaeota archaeon]